MRSCDWVSPLPPDRTDISNYAQRADVALTGTVRLNRIHDELAPEPSHYEFGDFPPFYNIGNDARFHGGAVQAALFMGGVVIAHDHLVQELLVSTLKAMPGDWESRYRMLMAQAYGKSGHQAALEFCAGNTVLPEISAEFPGIEIIASNALFMVSHNRLLANAISNRTGLHCFTLPLPIAIAADRPQPDRVQVEPDVLVFGFIGENRNIDALLDIIRSDDGPAFRLTIAGTIVSNDLRREVEQAVADGYDVDFPGFLDDEELNERIHRADLVVNVRSPSMGEVSGSQLRVFANCGLSVVSNDHWYATLPDDTVFKVDPQTAARDLKTVIETVARSPREHQGKRLAGYRYVAQNHSLDRYRDSFVRMLDDSPQAIRHGIGVRIAARSADLYNRAGAGPFIGAEEILNRSRQLCGWSI